MVIHKPAGQSVNDSHDHKGQDSIYDQHVGYVLRAVTFDESCVHVGTKNGGNEEDHEKDRGDPHETVRFVDVDLQVFFEKSLHFLPVTKWRGSGWGPGQGRIIRDRIKSFNR